ncbi:MAG: Pentachlorophenol monooxygenase [Chitinophagaceae bacterium]|nr:Pentachlorophenol monooxygenase [Chitinophagaceae bacterium]
MSNPTFHKTQVVIAGAGPTGLSLAAQLIRHNVDFILIEKNEKTTELSKAVVVQARTLEIFQELGLSEEALQRGQVTTGMRLFYQGKQKVSLDLAGLGKGISEFTFALSLEQSKTEKLLAEYVTAHGKTIHWKSEFTRFEQKADGVTVFYKNEQGNEQQINADYLVGCDGAGSPVRHQLNLSFEGSTEPKLFYVADVLLKSPVINVNALHMYLIKKGFVLFFPMEGSGHYRIVGILPQGNTDKVYQFSDIAPLIKESIISPVTFEELRWFSTYKVHSRKAGAFMKDRCFIAGDAAHIHTPAGGQGMNTGIQDTYNLAWKIAYTLRGETKSSLLKTYDTERSENAKHLLQTTDRIFDIMSGVNPFWNFIRLNLFPLFFKVIANSPLAKRVVFPLLSQTDIAYPNSLLTLKSHIGKVKSGDRMHYFVFSNGKNIFHYLSEPCFKLLYFGNKAANNELLQQSKIKTSTLAFTEIPVSVFGQATDFYILLRPDNHISYIGEDINQCKKILDHLAN